MIRYSLAAPMRLAMRAAGAFHRRRGVRILLFHDVPEAQRDGFARLVDWVLERYGVLDPAGLGSRLAGGEFDDRTPCLFSFDDGFASNREVARDILEPRGVRGLFFVCPQLVDLSDADQRQEVARRILRSTGGPAADQPRLMSWEDLGALAEAGHTVGAHGASHRRLAGLAGGELSREIDDAGKSLAARLGSAPDWYAYAFGDIGSIDPPALGAIARRYRYCRSGIRGLNVPGTPRHALRADSIDLAAPPDYVKLIVDGGLDLLYGGRRRRLDAMAAGLSREAGGGG